jgi:hypothetical protein
MKNLLAMIICAVIGLNTASAQGKTTDVIQTVKKIKWETTSIELGSLKKGIPVEAIFEFTNTTSEPLILAEVKAGCGCTSVDYPKEPVLPGKAGKIKATYDARTPGNFSKTISVKTNFAGEDAALRISGIVTE